MIISYLRNKKKYCLAVNTQGDIKNNKLSYEWKKL